MARNNDEGSSQEQPNDNRVEELQTQLRNQGADMALMKERIASMAKMIESMTALVQASVATTTIPPAIRTEG